MIRLKAWGKRMPASKADSICNYTQSDSISLRLRDFPWIPVILLAPFFIWGIFGPLLYPHDPTAINTDISLQPPAWMEGGDLSYFLGTDQLGRDLLSRLIMGARVSLIVCVFGAGLSGIIGISIGMIAGYAGGKVDDLIMRFVEIWMSIPGIFFVLLLVGLMRYLEIGGLLPIIIGITLTVWMGFTRVIRGEVLSLKERDFVAIAKISGSGSFKILIKHILPNILNSILVLVTMQIGQVVMVEAGISYLGVGVQSPNTSWGLLISESGTYMFSAWWVPIFAGICITITILGSNLLGDWLRDKLDPRLRQL